MKFTERSVAGLRPKGVAYSVTDTALSGFTARVMPNGTISYSLVYTDVDGRRKRHGIGNSRKFTLTEARDAAMAARMKLNRGERLDAPEVSTMTVGAYLDEYEMWISKRLRDPYSVMIKVRSLAQPIETILLARLTVADIERARQLSNAGALSTERRFSMFRKALDVAVLLGYLETNPARRVLGAKVSGSSKIRYLSDAETAAIMGGKASPVLRVALTIAMNTGLRRNELVELQWGDVDFAANTISVREQSAKGGKRRVVPMCDTLRADLLEWRVKSGDRVQVIPIGIARLFTEWDAFRKAIKLSDFRWHDFRHDFASRLVRAGVDLYVVKDLLGHSSISMTERYAHLAPSAKTAAIATLDAEQALPKDIIIQA